MRAPGRSLDALNFFLADVRDGLGPYLAIYLLTVQKWNAASIGIVMSIAGIAAIVAQTPAGAWIDRSRSKRAIVVLAALAVTAVSMALPLLPRFLPVAIAQAVSGAAGSVFQPAIAAITLGIVGPRAFTQRTGRNEAFNHAGNVAAALLAGGLAMVLGPIAVFYVMAAMAVASLLAVLLIPAASIDDDQARGLARSDDTLSGTPAPTHTTSLKALFASRPMLIFAASVTVFHFANAAMLPLVGQKLALTRPDLGTTLMSACIVAAQLVMIPVALLVGARADRWGRKPLFIVGFATLAVRGALYPLSDNPFWLVAVQALDGVGAGIFGAAFPLVVADLTRGTGRFNVSQGAITTALGIGAALSTSVAGWVVVTWGYSAAFLGLALLAAAGLALYWIAMPETLENGAAAAGDDSTATQPRASLSAPLPRH